MLSTMCKEMSKLMADIVLLLCLGGEDTTQCSRWDFMQPGQQSKPSAWFNTHRHTATATNQVAILCAFHALGQEGPGQKRLAPFCADTG